MAVFSIHIVLLLLAIHNVGGNMHFAVTGAVLIHPGFAIASAEDISKIIPENLANNTKLIFWGSEKSKYALDVKDYILHPEFHEKVTSATIALLDLIAWGESGMTEWKAPVLPICMPIQGSGLLNEIYAVKMNDEHGTVKKEIFKMIYMENPVCEEYYYNAQLTYSKMNPVNPLCAVSEFSKTPCVWDAGTALITRQTWGFWKLLGFAVRSPGCGAPTKFLNMHDYLPWINDVISPMPYEESEKTYKLGMRRVSPIKTVVYKVNEYIPKKHGLCDRGLRGTVVYKDESEILVNKNFAQGFFWVAVNEMADFKCVKVELLVHTQSNAAIWVEHNCHRDVHGLHDLGGDRPTRERANIEVTLYAKRETEKKEPNPFRSTQHTTAWWPTFGRLAFGDFAPANLWWWNL